MSEPPAAEPQGTKRHGTEPPAAEPEVDRRRERPETGPDQPGGPSGRERKPVSDPGDDADFAAEHTSPTYADQQPGGPEGVPETESPEGYAGMDRGPLPRRRDDGQDEG